MKARSPFFMALTLCKFGRAISHVWIQQKEWTPINVTELSAVSFATEQCQSAKT